MTEKTMTPTLEELMRENPWRVIADMESLEAYSKVNEYVLEGDKDIIVKAFNKPRKNPIPKECEYNFHLPPMPFSGNLLDAKLVILSLNPGYVEYLNRDLVGMLSQQYKDEFLDAAKKHLRLEASSIYEHEVERIVGENYWYRKLQPLAEAVYGENSPNRENIFRDVALLQYIGYFSTKYHDSNLKLKGHGFLVDLLKHLSEKEDVMFLVMRAQSKWEDLFGKDRYNKLINENRLIDHVNSPLSQAITPNNLYQKDNDGNIIKDRFSVIVEHLTSSKCLTR